MSELVRKTLNRIESGELNIWDLCMHGEVSTDQFPCSDCSLCGGHKTCPIRFELDLGDDIAAERERCAKICDYRASLYPEGAAAKKEAQELGRRIRGQNG